MDAKRTRICFLESSYDQLVLNDQNVRIPEVESDNTYSWLNRAEDVETTTFSSSLVLCILLCTQDGIEVW